MRIYAANKNGAASRRDLLKGINLPRSQVQVIPRLHGGIAGRSAFTPMSCSFQEACAMAPSSCVPTDAAFLRGTFAMAKTTAGTDRTRGTAM